jgi:hypothetical protein
MANAERNRLCMTEHLRYRGLWGAVVLQAKADIQSEPVDSIEYAHAVAFFLGAGAWERMRTVIGDFLDLHGDDLKAFGRRCISQRRAAEGLDPLPERRASRAAAPLVTPIRPAADPIPLPKPAPSRPPARRVNPFFPRGIYAPPLASRA